MKISEKTQKMHFFQNSCTELAKIKNLHSTICLKVFPSSGRVALPPAFARNEQRGGLRLAVHFLLIFRHMAGNSPLYSIKESVSYRSINVNIFSKLLPVQSFPQALQLDYGLATLQTYVG